MDISHLGCRHLVEKGCSVMLCLTFLFTEVYLFYNSEEGFRSRFEQDQDKHRKQQSCRLFSSCSLSKARRPYVQVALEGSDRPWLLL